MGNGNTEEEDEMAWDPAWEMDMPEDEDEVGEEQPELELDEVKSLASDLQKLLGTVIDVAKGNWDEEKQKMITTGPRIPTVRLLGIQFQWEDSEPSNSGIPLYNIGADWSPEDRSSVVYSIDGTADAVEKGALTIRARFAWDMEKGRIQVRAQPRRYSWADVLTNEVGDQRPGEDALGEVPPTTIFFNESQHSIYRGKHTYVPLKLENPQFPQLGVGVYDVNWTWEFRLPDEENGWQEKWHTIRVLDNEVLLDLSRGFQMSRHRVFVTLALPNHPWTTQRIPDIRKGLPVALPLWAHALELACLWAEGATTRGEAAKMIADELYHCGKLIYQPNPHYVQMGRKANREVAGVELEEQESAYIAYFQFDKVLERLRGGHGLGPQFNCFDCALTVVALANILGCCLQAGKLQNQADIDASDANHYMDNRFEINPVRAIGQTQERGALPGVSKGEKAFFTYHTVAWSKADGSFGKKEDFLDPSCKVYDACVELLIDGRTYSPSGMPLGDAQTPSSYVHFLGADTADGKPRCKPQPITVVDVQISG